MQTYRKYFSAYLLAFCALFALTSAYTYAEEEYTEGAHYAVLSEAQPVQTGDQIEIVELFWYRCPHCFSIEPYVESWLETKPENTQFVTVPAIFSPRWEVHARMYLTMEALDLKKQLHTPLFNAIHDLRKPINNLDQFATWAEENGASEQDIRDTFDSFAVETKLNFARVMTQRYNIDGVPAFIIDGKYRTSVSQAGSRDELFKVINFLVDKAKSERAES